VIEGQPRGWKGVPMPNRKLHNISLVGPFHRKLATGSDVIFPRIFLSSSTGGGEREEEEVSLGVIMTNTEIKFHIVLFTLSSGSVSQSVSFKLLQHMSFI
jgi:hypothetical protein